MRKAVIFSSSVGGTNIEKATQDVRDQMATFERENSNCLETVSATSAVAFAPTASSTFSSVILVTTVIYKTV